ncbi:MAG: GtrA family protein [Candidatus Dormibacteria bacterium]
MIAVESAEHAVRTGLLAGSRWGRRSWARGSRFAVVGLVGLAVNQGLLWAMVTFAGMSYLLAAVLASQGSTLVTYVASELWVFRGRQEVGERVHWVRRLLAFDSLNVASLLLRLPLLFALTSLAHVNYLLSNLVAISVFMLVRFLISDLWIWRAPSTATAVALARGH